MAAEWILSDKNWIYESTKNMPELHPVAAAAFGEKLGEFGKPAFDKHFREEMVGCYSGCKHVLEDIVIGKEL